ncbi:trypsin-like peptidase domain-containing protein [Bradyrhizobium sp. CW4]|uniref:serine protease n=1 Tax=Bradyrhizobium sp. CW4 TaxID=2782687 RepID=UPI001FF8F540|nr:serine protease [Bradyrhizobium sp. CW4]MCK1417646.1 trypsin-like peptidase domain-containing protein [Bradyrhizobium sp. CW4]
MTKANPTTNPQQTFLTSAVVRVGRGGRGFIVGTKGLARYVVTAAHCLPRSRYPRPNLANGSKQLAFSQIIGPLGSKPTIWAELQVLNLIDDLAVFGELDDEVFSEEYAKLTDTAMKAGVPPHQVEMPGWVLSLDCRWVPCTVQSGDRLLHISKAKIENGMSGSPILNAAGAAIGLISTGSTNPSLADCLPPWIWRRVKPRH